MTDEEPDPVAELLTRLDSVVSELAGRVARLESEPHQQYGMWHIRVGQRTSGNGRYKTDSARVPSPAIRHLGARAGDALICSTEPGRIIIQTIDTYNREHANWWTRKETTHTTQEGTTP
jgi:hypothetical protein